MRNAKAIFMCTLPLLLFSWATTDAQGRSSPTQDQASQQLSMEVSDTNNAFAFVSDVTIPDGTVMSPGQCFTKTWRLRNSGTTSWRGTSLVFLGGAQMGAPDAVSVPTTAPGETVDISVPMTAPTEAGTYQDVWQMRTADGKFFGGSVFVLILVKPEMPPLVEQGGGARPILYLSAEGREPAIAGVYPDGRQLGPLVRSSKRVCIVCVGGSTTAVWSPDGSVFAYLGSDLATSESSLYIQNLQGKVKAVFTTKAEVSHPLWSPDGQRIAVFGGGGFVVIDIARQTVSQQYWLSPHGPQLTMGPLPRGTKTRWSPDGRKILVSGRSSVVVGTDTGGIKTIADRPVFTFWGPNSDAVYYFDIIYKGGDRAFPTDLGDFSLQKLDPSPPIKVMNAEQLKKALRLTEADLPAMSHWDERITLSPSGSRLAIMLPRASKETDIYLYDLSQGKIIAIDTPFQSVRTKDFIIALEWAPDEKSLATVGDAAGHFGIKVLDLKRDAWRTLAIIPHLDGDESVEDYYAFGFKTISWTQ